MISKKINPYFLFGAIGVIVYGLSITFGYTYLDDNVLILDNFFYLDDLSNLVNAFNIEVFHVLHASAAYYRPLLTISFMIDAQISGKSLYFYHVTNVVIHILNTSMFYILMQKLQFEKRKALFVALVFLVHPILTQAVAWVPGRNDSLLALYILPSFIFFINFLENGKWRDVIWHLIFWVAALFTKESAILFAGLCLVYFLVGKKRKTDLEKLIYLVISWFILAAIWFFMRSNALVNPVNYSAFNVVQTVLKNSPAILLYLGKVILPFNLSVLPTLQDSNLGWGIISVFLILLMFALTKKKNYKMMVFYLGWFGIFLIPSFVRPNTVYVPDFIEHRMYVPLIGLLLFASEIVPLKGLNYDNLKIRNILISYLVLMGILTINHSFDYQEKITFWENAVKHSPSHPLAHKNLGAMYYLDGRVEEAEVRYKKALELNPGESMVHNNLGLIYAKWGDWERAEKEYKAELELYPYYDNAHFNFGMLYFQRGEKEKAEEEWTMTLKINPDHANALQSLAHYYYSKGELDKAKYYAVEAQKRGIKL